MCSSLYLQMPPGSRSYLGSKAPRFSAAWAAKHNAYRLPLSAHQLLCAPVFIILSTAHITICSRFIWSKAPRFSAAPVSTSAVMCASLHYIEHSAHSKLLKIHMEQSAHSSQTTDRGSRVMRLLLHTHMIFHPKFQVSTCGDCSRTVLLGTLPLTFDSKAYLLHLIAKHTCTWDRPRHGIDHDMLSETMKSTLTHMCCPTSYTMYKAQLHSSNFKCSQIKGCTQATPKTPPITSSRSSAFTMILRPASWAILLCIHARKHDLLPFSQAHTAKSKGTPTSSPVPVQSARF